MGCRRLFIHVFEQLGPLNVPMFMKFNKAASFNLLLAIDKALFAMQSGLRKALYNRWPDLDITIIDESAIWLEIINNPNQFGIRQEPQTMNVLGWPNNHARNLFFFDDTHPTEHIHKLLAEYSARWFTQGENMSGSEKQMVNDQFLRH